MSSLPNLTEIGQFFNGIWSWSGSLVIGQPLYTFKTFAMDRAKGAAVVFPPFGRLWWKGYFPNAVGGSLSEGVTFATYKIGRDILAKNGGKLTKPENFGLSFVAGTLGAPINSFCEIGMMRQQKYGGTFWGHISEIRRKSGWQGTFRATSYTAVRDVKFTCGIFALNDSVKEMISPYFVNPLYRDLTASLISGVAMGALSTPPDRVKTRVQLDLEGKEYPTCWKATMKIIKDEGALSLWKGVGWRIATIAPTICLIATISGIVSRSPLVPDCLREEK